MNKTPDVRTRAILPRWACRVSIRYAQPVIKLQSVANLLAAGGITSGVGDWRVEKGSGGYGTYQIVTDDDPEYLDIVATDETESLFAWYDIEAKRRGFKVAS